MFGSILLALALAAQTPPRTSSVATNAASILADAGFDHIIVVINADEPQRSRFLEAIKRAFRDTREVRLTVFEGTWPNEASNWTMNVVISDSTREGKPDGGYVMAVAFARPIGIADQGKILRDLTVPPCAPRDLVVKTLDARVTAASDLKGMLVSSGLLARGFDASAKEVVDAFRTQFLPGDIIEHKKNRPEASEPRAATPPAIRR